MTNLPTFTSLFDIWDVPSLYAASSGLFLPAVLITARMQAIPAQTSPSPQASRKRPRP